MKRFTVLMLACFCLLMTFSFAAPEPVEAGIFDVLGRIDDRIDARQDFRRVDRQLDRLNAIRAAEFRAADRRARAFRAAQQDAFFRAVRAQQAAELNALRFGVHSSQFRARPFSEFSNPHGCDRFVPSSQLLFFSSGH